MDTLQLLQPLLNLSIPKRLKDSWTCWRGNFRSSSNQMGSHTSYYHLSRTARECVRNSYTLDLVTGRNCYSKPNYIFQRRAYNLWKPYNELVKSKREFVEEVKTICEKEIKKDDAARMSLQVYRNLIGVINTSSGQLWTQHTNLCTEQIIGFGVGLTLG
jgi:hypothetical protein